jgi:hypothetical protein
VSGATGEDCFDYHGPTPRRETPMPKAGRNSAHPAFGDELMRGKKLKEGLRAALLRWHTLALTLLNGTPLASKWRMRPIGNWSTN